MLPPPRFELTQTGRQILLILMGIGLITFIVGLIAVPERIWPNFLIAEYYLIGLGMGATFFIAIQYVMNGGWATAIRRIPEAMSSTLPIAGIGILILIFGIHTLYEWSHTEVVSLDPVLQEKSAWLNEPFFIIRLIGYFIIWIGLSQMIRNNSLRQDSDPDLNYTHKNVRNSTVFILIGVYTFCLASIDLIMSLQPHWYSTVFGFQNLTGIFLSSLAMITVFVVLLRKAGYTHLFTTEHLNTMGNLMLAFCIFWIYLWVSQHMLIWYANIPEETSYFVFRHFDSWGTLSLINVLMNWMVPFFILLSKFCKRHDQTMLQVSILLLLGHWLDLYIMIMPVTHKVSPPFSIWEIGPFVGIMALFLWMVLRSLTRNRLIPINDPYLVESLPAKEH